ncbi:MAG: YggT family protein [Actinomycetales bacterium]|nr:YggT family protein [Actinomycetales bacterium]
MLINITGWIVFALNIFLLALFARLILDYVRMFRPDWRPRGILMPLAEIIYTLTDRPLSFVRRFVPPLRLGPVALDLSFILLFFAISILTGILS